MPAQLPGEHTRYVCVQTPPQLLDGMTWNFVGWYTETLKMFSTKSQLSMHSNSTSWEAYKACVRVCVRANSSSTTGRIYTKFCRMIHWSTGKIIPPVWTSYVCQLNFLGSIQSPPNLLDGMTWTFVGWYIEELERFSDRSQLSMRTNSTSWEAYKACVCACKLLLNYWKEWH